MKGERLRDFHFETCAGVVLEIVLCFGLIGQGNAQGDVGDFIGGTQQVADLEILVHAQRVG